MSARETEDHGERTTSFLSFSRSSSQSSLHSAINTVDGFIGDFICLSEFKEDEGPVPVLIHPEKGEGSFDISSFVIKIMAVDYQYSTSADFNQVEDIQAILQVSFPSAAVSACTAYQRFQLSVASRAALHAILFSPVSGRV